MSKALRRSAYVSALVAALLLVATVGLLSWWQFASTQAARVWVSHTHDVIRDIDELGIGLRDAEIAQRGFLLTGEDSYLEPYNAARDRVTVLQGDLRSLTADNPAQQERLRALAPLAQQRLDLLARTLQLYRDSGQGAALAALRTDPGHQVVEQIQAILRATITEEDHLLASRDAAAGRSEALARWLALGGTAVAVVLLALAVVLLSTSRARLAAAEAAQRRLAGQMHTAFESISQGIGVFGPDFVLHGWNDCFNQLLDLPRPMMRDGTPYEAIAEQAAHGGVPLLEAEDQIRHSRNSSTASHPAVFERTRPADGRTFEIRRTMTADGGFVVTLTDITERVLAERTARDAQRLQAMGQLTGGIAHDFNNLLTVILGNLERLAVKLGDHSSNLPQIERAVWATKRGAALTQQLLAFARKQPLAPQPIDVSAMLPDIANLLQRTLGEHIELRVVDTAGLWLAMADPAQVENAMLNLALNARDAMPGGGRLTIELANKVLDTDYAGQHAEVTAGDYVMLGVSDTGTGMPPDVLARAFEPFFTTKAEGKGTGLGLAMVFGFAKQSGGHVKIYSEPGEGTTVRLYLPRAIGVALPAHQRPSVPTDLPHGSATVLIVEDEPAVREVAVGILRDLGYRVLEAGDGPEALRVFGDNRASVDLLLSDVVLRGGMKGNQVAERLVQIKPDMRVLYTTGYTENAVVHHGRLDDGVQLIGKPFSRESLARKVAEVLGPAVAGTRTAEDGNVVNLGARDRGRAP
jgi:signal transduction histidine kinase